MFLKLFNFGQEKNVTLGFHSKIKFVGNVNFTYFV